MKTERTMISGRLDGVEAQRLILLMLSTLPADVSLAVLRRLRAEAGNLSAEVRGYVQACVRLGSELRADRARYDRVDQVCISILKRNPAMVRQLTGNDESLHQKDIDVQKQHYAAALGIHNRMQRNRLEKGEVTLRFEQIEGICAAFAQPWDRRLWENQLLALFRDTSAPNRPGDWESDALQWLWHTLNALHQAERATARLGELDRQRLEDLFAAPQEALPDLFGEEPDKLYSVIAELAAGKRITVPDIAQSEIGVVPDTWYKWRKQWIEAESNGFRTGIPKNRLSRAHIMLLAVLFELNYLQSVYLLALAGYRYAPGEPDEEVVRTLLGRGGAKSPAALHAYLQDGIFCGRW